MSTIKARQGCSNVKRTLALRDDLAKSIRLTSNATTSLDAPSTSKQTNRFHENRLKLIKLFKQQELLWNEQHQSYGSESLRKKAWHHLAKETGLSTQTCQRLVQSIRSSYEFKRKSLTSYELAKDQPMWFYVAESFLKPIEQLKPPSSSPPPAPEPEIKIRDFIISAKKLKFDIKEFASFYPGLELPLEDEVKTEPVEVITSKTTCRTCLATFEESEISDQLVSVDEEWDEQKTLKQVYVELIGPTDPRLPSVICGKCAEMLQKFLEFRTICLTNAKIYLNTVSEIYNEHNYAPPESVKRPAFDEYNELGDADHEDTIVYVEPLPTLTDAVSVVSLCTDAKEQAMTATKVDQKASIVNVEPHPSVVSLVGVSLRIDAEEQATDEEDDNNILEGILVDQEEWAAKKPKLGRQKFLCNICGEHVLHKARHLKMHKENDGPHNVQCPHCPRNTFKNETVYRNHLKWRHKRNQQIKCKFCDLIFTCYTSRTDHQQEVHEKLLFHCLDCNKFFKNVRLLGNHQREVHRPSVPGENTTCQTCGKTFARRKLLLHHEKFVHSDTLMYCDKCNFSVKTRRSMVRHFRTVHPPDGRVEIFKCDSCSRVFKEASYLRKHVTLEHKGLPLFACSVCEETFVHQKQLRRHLTKRHADSQLPPKGSTLKRVYLDENVQSTASQVVEV